jgi:hypothetical protein
MKAVLAYFGFDGTWSAQHWRPSAIHVLPPMISITLIVILADATGLLGWMVWWVGAVILNVVWWLLLGHIPAWRRAYEQLPPRREAG